MRRKPLLRRTFSLVILVNLISLLLVTWFAGSTFRDFYIEQTLHDLENSTLLLKRQFVELIAKEGARSSEVNKLCRSLRFRDRLTVILQHGEVVGDSDHPYERMENHKDRPEFQQALKLGKGSSLRFSETRGVMMLYFAQPLKVNGEVVAILRISRSLDAIYSTLRANRWKTGLVWLVLSLLTSSVIFAFSYWIKRPLEKLNQQAELLATGGFEGNLNDTPWQEFDGFAASLNKMASRLDEHTLLIYKQRLEVEAILSSMAEALLAIDAQGRIVRINQALARVFNQDLSGAVQGQRVREVIRNTEFNKMVDEALSLTEPMDRDLTVYGPKTQHLLVRSTPLRDGQGNKMGALMVLNDITEIRRLENVRREFVSNVSHELRTPITSIRGFAETLQAGAIDDPEDARRFLDIIARQSERLSLIIEDLLSLSRIEQDPNQIKLGCGNHVLHNILEQALNGMDELAQERGLELRLDCPRDLNVAIQSNLFEQAIINLIENALKYSEGTWVQVKVETHDKVFRVIVQDNGRGIAEEHLPRLFERFYRVDKARSRHLGGTGLGLSIVKHIVAAHHGEIWVESQLEKGSSFIMELPLG